MARTECPQKHPTRRSLLLSKEGYTKGNQEGKNCSEEELRSRRITNWKEKGSDRTTYGEELLADYDSPMDRKIIICMYVLMQHVVAHILR